MMKRNINIVLTGLTIALMASSCKKDKSPSIDDYPLNYTIPKVAVSSDIPVGAYVYDPSGALVADEIKWTRITETYNTSIGKLGPNVQPTLGRYELKPVIASVSRLDSIARWARESRIDFLITPPIRENGNALFPNNLNGTDSLLVNMFAEHNTVLPSVNMGEMKYAISVDIQNFSAGLSNNLLLEGAPATVINVNGQNITVTREQRLYNFLKRISLYFKDLNYYHSQGRPVLVFIGADKLYTEDSKKVYDNIRSVIKEQTGKDVYIIARQPQWTPSARFEYFFNKGKVDAVSMDNMCNVGGGATGWDRSYLLNRLINENYKLNKDYLSKNFGIDFIPSVSPSYTTYINNANPDYSAPTIRKNENDFRERCNVAKMNLGNNRMVLIESMNNWTWDSQIEPTVSNYGEGYGSKYLDIVRQEFKVQ
ncbi:glycoside hydrolase family 71/99 protein [Pedobacter hiemivivus]|uniref:Uncharacterized protein n=1 Tax=Pedobacter hiemivivus TaxID=2530454 RepID=A0A4R0NJH9_9SPHI|nr:hypothetical protein [Pedobacter hiemivivus]TCC99582.1 hypothetical protein EZ444_02585 [Pedobacter hiemivivus]